MEKNRFLEKPFLNSPYEYPVRYWEPDDERQPTQQIIERRRRAELTEVYRIETDFEAKVEAEFNRMIEQFAAAKE